MEYPAVGGGRPAVSWLPLGRWACDRHRRLVLPAQLTRAQLVQLVPALASMRRVHSDLVVRWRPGVARLRRAAYEDPLPGDLPPADRPWLARAW